MAPTLDLHRFLQPIREGAQTAPRSAPWTWMQVVSPLTKKATRRIPPATTSHRLQVRQNSRPSRFISATINGFALPGDPIVPDSSIQSFPGRRGPVLQIGLSAASPPMPSRDLFGEMEAALQARLEALPPAARAALLHVLRLRDVDRAERIGEFGGTLRRGASASCSSTWRRTRRRGRWSSGCWRRWCGSSAFSADVRLEVVEITRRALPVF